MDLQVDAAAAVVRVSVCRASPPIATNMPPGGTVYGRVDFGMADMPADGKREKDPCEFCGAAKLVWRKCKLVCSQCGNINKSCADL